MRNTRTLVASILVVVAANSAMLAAPGQDRPGLISENRVLVQNKGKTEAVPIIIESLASESAPLRVEVIGTAAASLVSSAVLQTRATRQQWEHRVITVAAGQDVSTVLASAGSDGWEAVGLSLTPQGAATVLLKRPR